MEVVVVKAIKVHNFKDKIRNTNPSIILKKDEIKFVEENISKVQEHWNQKCD